MHRLIVVLVGLLFGSLAQAHTAGTQSYAQLKAGNKDVWEWSWRVRIADFRSQPAAHDAGALAAWLAGQSLASTRQGDCTLRASHPTSVREGWLQGQWSVACPGPLDRVHLSWLQKLPGHLHMLQLDNSLHVLRGGEPQTLPLAAAAAVAPSTPSTLFWSQWHEGLAHIVLGWDHLAFLLGLLLWAARLKSLVGLVTGFTLGHSSALLLTVLAGVMPPALSIELIIAASIVFVALPHDSRAQRRSSSLVIIVASVAAYSISAQAGLLWAAVTLLALGHLWQPQQAGQAAFWPGLVLASLFGLLHGFGFAGAVLEATASTAYIWPILLGFNLGVEAGQLALVLPAWWVLQRWRHGAHLLPTAQALSCGLGAYWFCQRILAL